MNTHANLTIRDTQDYAESGANALRINFGDYALMEDRSRVGNVSFPALSSTMVLVDTGGIERRDCRIGDTFYKGPSAPSSACVMPVGQPVDFAWFTPRKQSDCIIFDFSPGTIERILPEHMTPRIESGEFAAIAFVDAPRLTLIAELLRYDLLKGPAGFAPETTGGIVTTGTTGTDELFRIFLVETLRLVGADDQSISPWRYRKDRRLSLALEYIEANLTGRLSLTELSAIAGISPTHLSTLFQRELGLSPYSYIIERRVARAERRLANSEDTLAAIAHDCGFCDQAHMTRLFRKRRGTTPGAIRGSR